MFAAKFCIQQPCKTYALLGQVVHVRSYGNVTKHLSPNARTHARQRESNPLFFMRMRRYDGVMAGEGNILSLIFRWCHDGVISRPIIMYTKNVRRRVRATRSAATTNSHQELRHHFIFPSGTRGSRSAKTKCFLSVRPRLYTGVPISQKKVVRPRVSFTSGMTYARISNPFCVF